MMKTNENSETKQTYFEHLEELRKRLINSFIAIIVATVGSFIFADRLFKLLVQPLLAAMPEDNQRLIFTNLPEAFVAYLKIALVAGIFISSPIILWQIWLFISPGLFPHEKKYAFPFVFFVSMFFTMGGLFCFYQVFPWGFRFFLGFANDYIEAMPKMSEYITFSLKLIIVFGLIFQLPVLIYFLTKIGLVTGEFLAKNRKYAILIVFVIAAILTPPDVITQLMLGFPLVILYELGILIAKVVDRNKEKKRKASAEEARAESECDSGTDS